MKEINTINELLKAIKINDRALIEEYDIPLKVIYSNVGNLEFEKHSIPIAIAVKEEVLLTQQLDIINHISILLNRNRGEYLSLKAKTNNVLIVKQEPEVRFYIDRKYPLDLMLYWFAEEIFVKYDKIDPNLTCYGIIG